MLHGIKEGIMQKAFLTLFFHVCQLVWQLASLAFGDTYVWMFAQFDVSIGKHEKIWLASPLLQYCVHVRAKNVLLKLFIFLGFSMLPWWIGVWITISRKLNVWTSAIIYECVTLKFSMSLGRKNHVLWLWIGNPFFFAKYFLWINAFLSRSLTSEFQV